MVAGPEVEGFKEEDAVLAAPRVTSLKSDKKGLRLDPWRSSYGIAKLSPLFHGPLDSMVSAPVGRIP